MNDLERRIEDACGQLTRYGGTPFCEEIVEVLELLVEINDDSWHGRNKSLTVKNVARIKALADKIVEMTRERG